MKKLTAIAAGLIFGAVALPAQQQVVKDAERAAKEGQPAAKVVEIITPAFTDPATAAEALTYVVPGKALFSEYDQLLGLKSFNKLPEGGDQAMVDDLLLGFDFYTRALPLDSVADAKGKIKTKHSKEILNTLAGHFTDYNSAAVTAWELKQYDKAYRAWDIFLDMAADPRLKINNLPADTTLSEIAFNQALAAWQADSLNLALKSFMKARKMGYNKKALYDYAIAVGASSGANETVYELAQEANGLYGNEDPNYLGHIINYLLQANRLDEANAQIDAAIAQNPDNAQYYVVKGILLDNQDKKAEAKALFEKAVSLDANNSMALYNMGRALCEEAYTLSDSAPTTPAESEKFYNEKIVPLFRQAAEYLENAWNIDNNNTDALRYLDNVYYNLHDENMMKDVKARLGE